MNLTLIGRETVNRSELRPQITHLFSVFHFSQVSCEEFSVLCVKLLMYFTDAIHNVDITGLCKLFWVRKRVPEFLLP